MPELPEVETICRTLRQGQDGQAPVTGRTIRSATVLWARTLAEPAEAEFLQRISGKTIQQIGRRGKFLIFSLAGGDPSDGISSAGYSLIIHLRMSGDLWLERQDNPAAPHHRLWLDFSDGWRLAFNDARKFGRVWLTRQPQDLFKNLGPEPFDETLTPELFFQKLQGTQRALKPLLLDQSFLAGVGNIYADEALHLARLHPLYPANGISLDQAGVLLAAIRRVLEEGIRRNGASIDWVYRGGDFQNYFRVYQRTGEPCPVCGAPVERLVIGQRSAHVCPLCQPRPV